jgi:hypothetical protein
MSTRRLLAATAITCVGLAMCIAASQLPAGNEDIAIVFGFFGVIVVGIGVLHPFQLQWKGLVILVLGMIALGFVFPLMQAFR